MKSDPVYMALLFDQYGQLLTDKQRTCFDLYYNQDFSLAEIAEEAGVSRQGVHDCLARAESTLLAMEENTHGVRRARNARQGLAAIRRCAGLLQANQDPATRQLAEEILAAVRQMEE